MIAQLNSIVLLFLLYLNIKLIRKYIDTDDANYVIAFAVLLFLFFNLWLGAYAEILGRFQQQFTIAMNALPMIIVIVLVWLEGKRKKEERERRKTREFFSKYVSEKIVDTLLKEKQLELGGEKHQVTVLFTDVRGFTAMSERLDPKQVVEVLNGHFDIINEEIFRENGTVLKYIGDSAMAVFNAPILQKDHAEKAVRACIAVQKRMKEYSSTVKGKMNIDFAIGIGINSGEAVVGNIGSHKYMDYTVIGDAVNTASRLNGIAKAGEIVVSESTYELIKDKFRFSKPEEVPVKGKVLPVKVYRVLYE
ncbi:MAG: adenylate/guanylate cyclase domain-containing protein [Candidatus Micrarchaeia archaeon]